MSEVIWWGTVDNNKFDCHVYRVDENTGHFVVKVVDSGEELVNETVPLAYGAPFGPDVEDVCEWQGVALEAIDKWLEKR